MPKICVGKKNVKVYIRASMPGFFGGLGSGGVRSANTGSDGCADISFSDFGASYHGEIVVNGKTVHNGEIEDDATYCF